MACLFRPLAVSARDDQPKAAQSQHSLDEMERDEFPSFLPVLGTPRSVVSFYLDDKPHWHPSSPRLAVLSYDKAAGKAKVSILKAEDGKFVTEFALVGPGGMEDWIELESFPSATLPGVVIWGSVEYSRDRATIVCYVNRRFEVVFKGDDVQLMDIDSDGIPEIVTGFGSDDVYAQSEYSQVWTWDGTKYVRVAQVRLRQLFFADVVKALQAVRKNKKTSSRQWRVVGGWPGWADNRLSGAH